MHTDGALLCAQLDLSSSSFDPDFLADFLAQIQEYHLTDILGVLYRLWQCELHFLRRRWHARDVSAGQIDLGAIRMEMVKHALGKAGQTVTRHVDGCNQGKVIESACRAGGHYRGCAVELELHKAERGVGMQIVSDFVWKMHRVDQVGEKTAHAHPLYVNGACCARVQKPPGTCAT